MAEQEFRHTLIRGNDVSMEKVVIEEKKNTEEEQREKEDWNSQPQRKQR